MRSIRFRGLDIKGTWHTGLLAESGGFIRQPEDGVYISNFAGYPYAYRVRDETIGQFAGIKDRKGNDVYEGDKIKAEHGYVSYFGEVVFDEGAFSLKIISSSDGYDGHAPDYDVGQKPELNNFDSIEITGNIYECMKM